MGYFFFLDFGFLVARLIIAMMATKLQTIWSVKENQAFFGKRPIAMRVPAARFKNW